MKGGKRIATVSVCLVVSGERRVVPPFGTTLRLLPCHNILTILLPIYLSTIRGKGHGIRETGQASADEFFSSAARSHGHPKTADLKNRSAPRLTFRGGKRIVSMRIEFEAEKLRLTVSFPPYWANFNYGRPNHH